MILRMFSTPFVTGRRYFEARIRRLEPTAVGSVSWRVGWAGRKFVGDWSRDVGIGDDSHSLGVACVLTSNATAELLYGERRSESFGHVASVHPRPTEGRRPSSSAADGVDQSNQLEVEKLGTDTTQPGVGWHAGASDGHCAHVVFQLERPGLLTSIAGANLYSHKYALDYCLVAPGATHPRQDEEPGTGGWIALRQTTRVGRLAAIECRPEGREDAGDDHEDDEGAVGVLASHVRLTVYGKKAPPSWAQLQVFGVAGPPIEATGGIKAADETNQVATAGTGQASKNEEAGVQGVSRALKQLERISSKKDNGVVLAFMRDQVKKSPPLAAPNVLWQEGDVLCVAIDVPQRLVNVRAVGKAGKSAAECVRFPFPPGCNFTDGLVTPALTLQPGVEIELLPGPLDKMEHRRAPGEGYLPVVVGEGEHNKYVPICDRAPREKGPKAAKSNKGGNPSPKAEEAGPAVAQSAEEAVEDEMMDKAPPLKKQPTQKPPTAAQVTVHRKFHHSLVSGRATISNSGTRFTSDRDCVALLELPCTTGKHVVDFTLVTDSDDIAFGMSAPDSDRDSMSGHRPGSFGVRTGGPWVLKPSSYGKNDGVLRGNFASNWCKAGDTVRLEFDAVTHTLSFFTNGTFVDKTDQVEAGWHFTASRWSGSPVVDIVAASALKWTKVGASPPAQGEELLNAKLSFALKHRTDFTEQDIEAFELGELRTDHYIKSGSDYFQPSVAVAGNQSRRGDADGDDEDTEQSDEANGDTDNTEEDGKKDQPAGLAELQDEMAKMRVENEEMKAQMKQMMELVTRQASQSHDDDGASE